MKEKPHRDKQSNGFMAWKQRYKGEDDARYLAGNNCTENSIMQHFKHWQKPCQSKILCPEKSTFEKQRQIYFL